MPTNVKLIPEGFSQAVNRGVMFWFDQHRDPQYRNADGVAIFEQGRPYWSFVERPANGVAAPMPVGEVIPMGWVAPFYAPQSYLTRSIGRVQANGSWLKGAGSTSFFRIDYAQMLKDDKEATEAYYQLAVQEAVRQNMPIPQPGVALPPQLRAIVGPPPRSPKIAEACIAGDKWILGQQMPIWSEREQKYVVPENKYLASLLRAMGEVFLTQAEYDEMVRQQEQARQAVEKPSDEMRAMLDKLYAEIEELKKDRAPDAPKKRGRPPKASSEPAVAGAD